MPDPADFLPRFDTDLFVTDGGLETTLLFHEGFDLPAFAAYPLLGTDNGREALRRYFRSYLDIARRHGVGCVLETPTWRATRDWGRHLGHDDEVLGQRNTESVLLLARLVREFSDVPVVISGCIGPRGDGYRVDERMTVAEAEAYHFPQVRTLAMAGADVVSALTLGTSEEACGVALAAREVGIPTVLSFTVETDGRLPSGETLVGAIQRVDAVTSSSPRYYMVNCAHPTHFEHELSGDDVVLGRLGGVRANASSASHAELDEAEELDAGDPLDLAGRMAALRRRQRSVNVIGGCCGTDHRHVEAMVAACRLGDLAAAV